MMVKQDQSKRQTLEQKRAADAWKRIESEVLSKGDKVKSKYGTFARRFPSMIQISGLGSTMAFLLAKGKHQRDDGHTLLYDHVSNWVTNHITGQSQDIMDFIRKAETETYRRATAEAIAYGIWLKRYTEAEELGSAEGDDT